MGRKIRNERIQMSDKLIPQITGILDILYNIKISNILIYRYKNIIYYLYYILYIYIIIIYNSKYILSYILFL